MTTPGENIPFYKTVLLASVAGAAGGFVGTPADMINVRMQNDVKLPLETRRKYERVVILKLIKSFNVCMHIGKSSIPTWTFSKTLLFFFFMV